MQEIWSGSPDGQFDTIGDKSVEREQQCDGQSGHSGVQEVVSQDVDQADGQQGNHTDLKKRNIETEFCCKLLFLK